MEEVRGDSVGKIKRCAIVVRVSDSRQATSEENTIDLQTNEIRKFIESRNFNENGIVYIEHKVYKLVGVSGSKSFYSTQFNELELDIANGKVQVVICTALDRLGRDVPGFIEFWEYLSKNKVELIITRMSLDTSTPVGQMLLVVLMALSKLELDIKTERNRESTRNRGEKGLYNGGRPILGYDLNPDPNIAGRLVVNEKEAPIVKMAFEKYHELGSDKKVADWLRSLGQKNKRWKHRLTGKWNGGDEITSNVVRSMLTNITYKALRRYSELDLETGERVEQEASGAWEAIVSIELFNKVQETRKRARASSNPSIFNAGTAERK
jgi:site-specific DNA recombinase